VTGTGGGVAAPIRKFAAAHGIPGAERRLFYAANDAVSYDRPVGYLRPFLAWPLYFLHTGP
jgi:hypothetical protein